MSPFLLWSFALWNYPKMRKRHEIKSLGWVFYYIWFLWAQRANYYWKFEINRKWLKTFVSVFAAHLTNFHTSLSLKICLFQSYGYIMIFGTRSPLFYLYHFVVFSPLLVAFGLFLFTNWSRKNAVKYVTKTFCRPLDETRMIQKQVGVRHFCTLYVWQLSV